MDVKYFLLYHIFRPVSYLQYGIISRKGETIYLEKIKQIE